MVQPCSTHELNNNRVEKVVLTKMSGVCDRSWRRLRVSATRTSRTPPGRQPQDSARGRLQGRPEEKHRVKPHQG